MAQLKVKNSLEYELPDEDLAFIKEVRTTLKMLDIKFREEISSGFGGSVHIIEVTSPISKRKTLFEIHTYFDRISQLTDRYIKWSHFKIKQGEKFVVMELQYHRALIEMNKFLSTLEM